MQKQNTPLPSQQNEVKHKRWFMPFLLFLFFASITLFTANYVYNLLEEEQQNAFTRQTTQLAGTLTARLYDYIDIMYAGRGLFVSSRAIGRDKWFDFINSQGFRDRFTEIQALEYVQRVSNAEKQSFINEVRGDTSLIAGGYPEFTIHPEGDRTEYYVVNYIEPYYGNEKAFGFDMLSFPEGENLITAARDNDQVMISPPLSNIQGKTYKQTGFLILMPVYEVNAPTKTITQRRAAIKGFVVGAFGSNEILENIISSETIGAELYDITDANNTLPIATFNAPSGTTKFSQKHRLNVGGRTWEIRFNKAQDSTSRQESSFIPQTIIIAGIIISILLSILYFVLQNTRNNAIKLAKKLTRNLSHTSKRLKLATNAAHMGVWEWKIDKDEIHWNKNMFQLYNTSPQKLKNNYKGWKKLIHPDDLVRFDKEIQKALQGKKQLDTTFRVYGKYKQIRYIRAFGILNKQKDGNSLIGVNWDITKEKEIDRAKTEFVSLASHQLRTPLSSINWYTEMLLDGDVGNLNEKQLMYLDEVYKGSQRMVSLVSALLNVSRLELGTFMYEPQDVEIIKTTEEVIDLFKKTIEEKKLKLTTTFSKNLPTKMFLDKKSFESIIQNLLSNSIKYNDPKGKIGLDISYKDAGETVEKFTLKKPSLLITVKDTGYGIPVKQKSQIFTKMFRADNVRKTDTDGTGLGLYLIKLILDHVKGKIWFTSKENHGSSFYVILPKAEKQETMNASHDTIQPQKL